MATATRVSNSIPSAHRSVRVTAVVAGDQIDFEDLLGRPARRIKIVPHDALDTIDFRINNRVRIMQAWDTGERHPTPVEVISDGAQHSLFRLNGSTEYLTDEGLRISFLDIDAIVFGAGGTEIEVIGW